MIDIQKNDNKLYVKNSLAYFTLFFCYGVYFPFFTLWANDKLQNDFLLNIALSLPIIIRTLLFPFLSQIYDYTKIKTANYLTVLTLVITLFIIIEYIENNIIFMSFFIGAITLFFNILPHSLDTYSLDALRNKRISYGRVRMWGSVSLILGIIVSSFLLNAETIDVFSYLMILGLCVCIISGFILPSKLTIDMQKVTIKKQYFDFLFFTKISFESWSIFFAGALVLCSHAPFQVYGPLILHQQGYSMFMIGIFWLISAFSEILIFASNSKLSIKTTFYLASTLSCLRWFLMAFSESFIVIFICQLTHGITFGLTHLIIMSFIQKKTDYTNVGKLKGIWLFVNGFAFAITIYLSGIILHYLGPWFYISVALLPLTAFLIIFYNVKILQT